VDSGWSLSVLGLTVHAPFGLWTDLARTQHRQKWSVQWGIHQTLVCAQSVDSPRTAQSLCGLGGGV
jgi:hypothetical protein